MFTISSQDGVVAAWAWAGAAGGEHVGGRRPARHAAAAPPPRAPLHRPQRRAAGRLVDILIIWCIFQFL